MTGLRKVLGNKFLGGKSIGDNSCLCWGIGCVLQRVIQTLLLLVIVACVPWMLLPKPLILRQRHRQRSHHVRLLSSSQSLWGYCGGSPTAVRPSDPALCGSCPL